jgi:hypothetical protein
MEYRAVVIYNSSSAFTQILTMPEDIWQKNYSNAGCPNTDGRTTVLLKRLSLRTPQQSNLSHTANIPVSFYFIFV